MEHIAGDKFDRTYARQILTQPPQYKCGYHLTLTGSAVAVNLDGKDRAVFHLDRE